ncbi:MAG: hypothetical protein ABSE93_26620, partial [Terriglobia bacterium]
DTLTVPPLGASAIQCWYAALGRRIFSILAKMAESNNAIVTTMRFSLDVSSEAIQKRVSGPRSGLFGHDQR